MTAILYNKKRSLSKAIINLFNIFLLSILIMFSYVTWNDSKFVNAWAEIISGLSIILLIYHLFSFYLLKVKITDFRLWFIFLTNLFMFGRVYLSALNYDENIFWNLLSRYPNELLYLSGLYALCSLQGLFIGFTFYKKSGIRSNINFFDKIDEQSLVKIVFNTGTVLVFISLPFRLFSDFISIQQAQSAGSYSGLSSSSGLSDDFATLFLPGVIYLICSKKWRRKTTFLLLVATITYYFVIITLTGDRRYPVTAILTISLCYIASSNIKISFRQVIGYFIVGGILLNFLSVIRNTRNSGLTTFSGFFKEYWNIIITNNPLYETLSEFGLSFISLVGIIKNIPEVVQYQYGFSFFGAIPSILPIGWLFGDFFKDVSISRTINDIEEYPVGATLLGDLYANFGWLSVGIIIIFGLVLSRIFTIDSLKSRKYFQANYFALFYILINLVRSSFFEILRPTILVYLLPLIIMYFFYGEYYSRNKFRKKSIPSRKQANNSR